MAVVDLGGDDDVWEFVTVVVEFEFEFEVKSRETFWDWLAEAGDPEGLL